MTPEGGSLPMSRHLIDALINTLVIIETVIIVLLLT